MKTAKQVRISNKLLDNMLVSLKSKNDLCDDNRNFTQLNKAIHKHISNAEINFHLDASQSERLAINSWNVHNKKKVRSSFNKIKLDTTQHRQSTFQHSTELNMTDNVILSLYIKCMTIRYRQANLTKLHYIEVSHSLIKNVIEAMNNAKKQLQGLNSSILSNYYNVLLFRLKNNKIIQGAYFSWKQL